MLLAIGWWGMLLYRKNKELHEYKRQHISSDTQYQSLLKEYQRDTYMIVGEGLVLGLTMLAGIWIINRSASREIASINNQNNFLLSVSHELKSPIAAIKLAIETVLRPKLPEEKKAKLLTQALDDTDRLQSMVQNVLLSASIDTEELALYNEHLDINGIIYDLIKKYEKKGISISHDLPQKEVSIKGDKKALEMMINNIIENGVKYSDRAPLDISAIHTDRSYTISIADHGIGIPDKEKMNIFNRFYRVSNPEVRERGGTGLGLYLAHQIALAHGGDITVSDNGARGSIFSITLPLS